LFQYYGLIWTPLEVLVRKKFFIFFCLLITGYDKKTKVCLKLANCYIRRTSNGVEKYLTQEGLEKLKKELEYLRTAKRQEIAERLEKSIAFGDLTENSEYHEAKEAQAFIEGRILDLEDLIQNAIIVPSGEKRNGLAQIGSTILVSAGKEKERFKIVGAEEADPLVGKISIDSPLGKALLAKTKGAVIEVSTPAGKLQYKILNIE